MFGDNKTIVDNIMTRHGKTHKRHVELSFHCSRDETAVKIVKYFFINGKINPADLLTKHWARHNIWP